MPRAKAGMCGPDRIVASPDDLARSRTGLSGVRVGIGRVAEMTGVSLRTLRHYEAVGLLRPARGRTRERTFSTEQAEAAALIVLLRRHDVSIPEIRRLLQQTRPGPDRDRATVILLHARADGLRMALLDVEVAIRRHLGHDQALAFPPARLAS